jgi:CRISPR-associated endonuclease Csn1
VQKLTFKNYYFRHHLETNVEDTKELRDIAWKSIRSNNHLKGIVKIRVNHLGQIVKTGEY